MWPEYSLAMTNAARETAKHVPLSRRAKDVGDGWDHPNNSSKLFQLEECVRTHIFVVAEQPLFNMPIKWAQEELPPDMLGRIKAVYDEMAHANGDSGSWPHFKVENLLLCICFRLAYNLEMANFKQDHVAEAMGFEPPKRATFYNTRTRFFVYLKAQSPPPIAPLPPPGPAMEMPSPALEMPSPALEMMGVHALAALQAPQPQEPSPPLMWTIDEVMAAVLGLEDAGELGQLSDEIRLEQFASLATMR